MVGKRRSSRATLNNAGAGGSNGPAAKRVDAGHARALAGLTLQLVLQFAGKNEGIFIANVCDSWKKAYKSTFDDQICTHRAAAMMSLQRVQWVWLDWSRLASGIYFPGYRDENHDPSWYLGKYSPRLVVKAAIRDESLAVSSKYLMQGVAASGRLALIEDLWKAHIPPRVQGGRVDSTIPEAGAAAAAFGHVQILAFIWSHLIEKKEISYCGESCADAAAREGHIPVLEFLSLTDWWDGDELHGPCKYLRGVATANNQIEVLRWLAAHGHPYDEQVALAAAVYSKVETLNFLLENGCPGMDKNFVSLCVQHGSVETLQWCYETLSVRVPGLWLGDNLQEWLLLAGTFDEKDKAKFLLEHGALWPNIGQRFGQDLEYIRVDNGGFDFEPSLKKCIWSPAFMEWAMAEGCTFDTWTVTTCSRLVKETDWQGYDGRPLLETLAWAHEHGCPCPCLRHIPDF